MERRKLVALVRNFKPKGIKSGQFYTFKYSRYQNDPLPLALFLFSVRGKNPKTQHYNNYLQCINMHYLHPGIRLSFFNVYKRSLRGKLARIFGRVSWKMLEKKYPSLVPATRRYNPRYIIGMSPVDIQDVPDLLKKSKYYRNLKK